MKSKFTINQNPYSSSEEPDFITESCIFRDFLSYRLVKKWF